MRNVLYGCGCACLIAVTLMALELRTAAIRLDTELQLTSANLAAVAQNAVAAEKQIRIAAEALTVDGNDVRGIVANIAVATRDADLVQRKSIEAQDALITSINHTNDSLTHLSTHGTAALDEATEALHNTSRAALAASILVEKATPPAVSTLSHVDATTSHVEHIAEHYDAVLTEKQTKWQKIKSAIWFPLKVAIKVW
jgi:hypothetical protein